MSYLPVKSSILVERRAKEEKRRNKEYAVSRVVPHNMYNNKVSQIPMHMAHDAAKSHICNQEVSLHNNNTH